INLRRQGYLVAGQQGSYSIVVNNASGAARTTGPLPVTVLELPPPGVTVVKMDGIGWQCGNTICSRPDGLNGGQRFSPISVFVDVAQSRLAPVVTRGNVFGGGSVPAYTASDSSDLGVPLMILDRTTLNFGSAPPYTTQSQTVNIHFVNGAGLNWR